MPRHILMPPTDDDFHFSLFDTTNPNSLKNKLPEFFHPHLETAKDTMQRYYHVTDGKLRERLEPDERDERLRLTLWDEYNLATSEGRPKMRIKQMLLGAGIAWEAFEQIYGGKEKKLAWIFTAPTSYVVAMRQILHRGQERLLEIMNLPLMDDKGRVNTSLVANILRTFQMVDLRVKGAVLQRLQVEQRTLNVNTDVSPEKMMDLQIESLKGMSLEELELLERKMSVAERTVTKKVDSLPSETKREILELSNHNPISQYGEPIVLEQDPLEPSEPSEMSQ